MFFLDIICQLICEYLENDIKMKNASDIYKKRRQNQIDLGYTESYKLTTINEKKYALTFDLGDSHGRNKGVVGK